MINRLSTADVSQLKVIVDHRLPMVDEYHSNEFGSSDVKLEMCMLFEECDDHKG